MVWLWRRIFEERAIVEAEQREEAQARAPVKEVDAAPPPSLCRACGYEGLERYCPRCLADTMIVRRRRRRS
jgi:hypothetical protein